MKLPYLFPLLLLLASCAKEQIHYTMPSEEFYSDTVITPEPEYHQVVIQSEMHAVDRMEQFEEWRKQREAEDKHEAYSEAWNRDDEIAAMEEELERYCNSLFSNTCLLNMKEFCDHNGCREVKVECDNFRDSDDVCVKHDIDISDELR